MGVCHGHKGPQFSVFAAISIAQRVARACEYLHGRGIYHGDVYLHNTLVVPTGAGSCMGVADVRLSDFGAACAVDELHRMLFKIEVRSFGWLIEDLLAQLDQAAIKSVAGMKAVALLQRVRKLCGNTIVADLPDFTQLGAELDSEISEDAPLPSL